MTDLKKGRTSSLSSATIQKIAQYFDVPTDYLINGTSADDTKPDLSDMKTAIFGEEEVPDELWDEVVRFARFIKCDRCSNRTAISAKYS